MTKRDTVKNKYIRILYLSGRLFPILFKIIFTTLTLSVATFKVLYK